MTPPVYIGVDLKLHPLLDRRVHMREDKCLGLGLPTMNLIGTVYSCRRSTFQQVRSSRDDASLLGCGQCLRERTYAQSQMCFFSKRSGSQTGSRWIPIEDLTALNLVLGRMQKVGLYLMYGVRSSYRNSTVAEQANAIRNRQNLLLWYSADKPDATSDPLNATTGPMV